MTHEQNEEVKGNKVECQSRHETPFLEPKNGTETAQENNTCH
jgi:hypothetical protein